MADAAARFRRFAFPALRLIAAFVVAFGLIPFVDAPHTHATRVAAAGYTVNTLADAGDGLCDATCTLRDAILTANASAGADTVGFGVDGTIMLLSALPAITDTLSIDASGLDVTVDGNNAFRVFSTTAPLTLTALTVQHGSALGDGGGAYFGGPAVLNATLFSDNAANIGKGGGAFFAMTATVTGSGFFDNTSSGDFGHGGGAYFAGPTTLDGSLFLYNIANFGNGGGAAFNGPAAVSGTVFHQNEASLNGGGAYFAEAVELTGTTFMFNNSSNAGGAVFATPAALTNAYFMLNTSETDGGGAIFMSTATLSATSFLANTASNGAGGARFDDTAVLTATTFHGNLAVANWGGGAVVAGDNSSIHASTFLSNTAGDTGGGLFILPTVNVSITSSHLMYNQSANSGGGLSLGQSTHVNLDNSFVAANVVLAPLGGAEISLGPLASLTGRHNTLAAQVPDAVLALDGGITTTVMLTNTIFHGYAVAAQTGDSASLALDGVLWSSVTTSTQGAGITVTNAISGTADFVNPAARDYHLSLPSAARNSGVATTLSVDFEGDARPIGPAPDIGADEHEALAPIAVDDSATTLANQPVMLDVLGNDSDPNGDLLQIVALGVPASGSAVISGTTQIVYTPAQGSLGPQVFNYTVSDGGLTATASVTVTVVAYRLFLPLLRR